ncbi:MAG: hypothetical protein ACRDMV_12485 [Streptosporangiales bacterium]
MEQLPVIILAVIGFVSPYLTELLTKLDAPRWLKSGINFALTALGGAVTTVVYNPDAGAVPYLVAVAGTWGVSILVHYTGATAPVQNATADAGLGPKHGGPDDTDGGLAAVDSGDDDEPDPDVPDLVRS